MTTTPTLDKLALKERVSLPLLALPSRTSVRSANAVNYTAQVGNSWKKRHR